LGLPPPPTTAEKSKCRYASDGYSRYQEDKDDSRVISKEAGYDIKLRAWEKKTYDLRMTGRRQRGALHRIGN
jgi:hypothetical protein